jgi:hypothetical protein
MLQHTKLKKKNLKNIAIVPARIGSIEDLFMQSKT